MYASSSICKTRVLCRRHSSPDYQFFNDKKSWTKQPHFFYTGLKNIKPKNLKFTFQLKIHYLKIICRRYMAEILPIRRKPLSNQSSKINFPWRRIWCLFKHISQRMISIPCLFKIIQKVVIILFPLFPFTSPWRRTWPLLRMLFIF